MATPGRYVLESRAERPCRLDPLGQQDVRGYTALHAGLLTASRSGWVLLAGCGVATLVLGVASTGRRAQASAHHNGQRLTAG